MSAQPVHDPPLVLSLLDTRSLSDQVYQSLRHALMHRQFPAGTRMIETVLSEQLGVSRTPVREALNRLTVEGWLESRPNKGVAVSSITPKEIRERYTLREVLEGYGARAATEHISDEELDRLEGICDRAEKATDDDRGTEFAHLDGELHEGILRAAGIDMLLAVWRQFLNPARHAVFALGMPDHRRYLVKQHRRILEALRCRDANAVEEAMRQHLHYAMEAHLADDQPGTEE